jgi:hypothetical protein
LWLTALSIVLGFIAAYAALHGAGDVLVYVLLFMFGGLLGYVGPEAPWRWAIMIGIWVPIAEIMFRLTQPFISSSPAQLLQPLVALVPPFLGVYGGMIVRRWVPPPSPPPEIE